MLMTDSIWSLHEIIIYDDSREKVYFASWESQCFPRLRQSLEFIVGNFEAGNSLNLAVTEVVGQHSRVTVHCYPLTS